MAEDEFEDISYKAIAMLCTGRAEYAREMAERASESVLGESKLLELGNVVFTVGCEPLMHELERALGSEWVVKYQRIWKGR